MGPAFLAISTQHVTSLATSSVMYWLPALRLRRNAAAHIGKPLVDLWVLLCGQTASLSAARMVLGHALGHIETEPALDLEFWWPAPSMSARRVAPQHGHRLLHRTHDRATPYMAATDATRSQVPSMEPDTGQCVVDGLAKAAIDDEGGFCADRLEVAQVRQ